MVNQNQNTRFTDLPFKIVVNWNNVDFVDLTIDAAGLAGDVLFVLPEAPVTKIAYWATEVAEIAGMAKSFYDLSQGDPQNLAYNLTIHQFERAVIATKVIRLAPFIGPFGNSGSILLNLNPQIIREEE